MEQVLLKESETGIPYLEFPGTGGHISFVKWSKTNKGYTQLNFSFREQNVSFLTDINMKTFGSTDMKEVKKTGVGKILKPLIDIFEKLTVDGIFPYGNMDKLSNMIKDVTYVNKEIISPLKGRKHRKIKDVTEEPKMTKSVTRKTGSNTVKKKRKKK